MVDTCIRLVRYARRASMRICWKVIKTAISRSCDMLSEWWGDTWDFKPYVDIKLESKQGKQFEQKELKVSSFFCSFVKWSLQVSCITKVRGVNSVLASKPLQFASLVNQILIWLFSRLFLLVFPLRFSIFCLHYLFQRPFNLVFGMIILPRKAVIYPTLKYRFPIPFQFRQLL